MNKTEIIDLLESLRLPEEPAKDIAEVSKSEKEKKEEQDFVNYLNDPEGYEFEQPYLKARIEDGTIINGTAKRINEGKSNPFEVNWMEVTLYLSRYVRELLVRIDSVFVMDVAQAIEDEENRHSREDGYYTNVSSNYYGTGGKSAESFSYTHENYDRDNEYISPVSIAKEILDTRTKAEAFKKKVDQHKGKKETKNLPEISNAQEIIEQLQKERDEWKKKYEEALEKEPEYAFNAATNNKCFTKAKIGLLIYAIASTTDGPLPKKADLIPIISAIGGWQDTSVRSAINKAGFSQNDINQVASLFENAMPKFAEEIKKLIPRKKKQKK